MVINVLSLKFCSLKAKSHYMGTLGIKKAQRSYKIRLEEIESRLQREREKTEKREFLTESFLVCNVISFASGRALGIPLQEFRNQIIIPGEVAIESWGRENRGSSRHRGYGA